MLLQIVIQLQKFAEAVSRIKGAVGSVNDKKAPTAAPGGKSAYSSEGVFGRDLSSMLSTDLTGIDPSLGGEFKDSLLHCAITLRGRMSAHAQLWLAKGLWFSKLCSSFERTVRLDTRWLKEG